MKAEIPGEKGKYRVRILKKSKKHDLALLQVAIKRSTPYLEIRDPKTLVPGEEVWAVGNPLLAFKETVTKGIFSRIFLESDWKKELKMKRPPYKFKGDWVQFSAPIIGGNSGGPLVDKEGHLIGIVSLGNTLHKAINFAVPSSYIKKNLKPISNKSLRNISISHCKSSAVPFFWIPAFAGMTDTCSTFLFPRAYNVIPAYAGISRCGGITATY